jgi:hypothetical protein
MSKCNLCGLSCKLNSEFDTDNDYGLKAKVSGGYLSTPGAGYGALDDSNLYKFSLCEFCLDWLFTQFKIPVNIVDMIDYKGEKFKPAANRVKDDDWRKEKDKFFAEYKKRNVARLNLRCNVTKNPCGTDTWANGYKCQCESCQLWLEHE